MKGKEKSKHTFVQTKYKYTTSFCGHYVRILSKVQGGSSEMINLYLIRPSI